MLSQLANGGQNTDELADELGISSMSRQELIMLCSAQREEVVNIREQNDELWAKVTLARTRTRTRARTRTLTLTLTLTLTPNPYLALTLTLILTRSLFLTVSYHPILTSAAHPPCLAGVLHLPGGMRAGAAVGPHPVQPRLP
jgi:hypothetical protein